MALVVDVAILVGALATVLGVVVALRGQRREGEPASAAQGKHSFAYSGLDASHLVVEIPGDRAAMLRRAKPIWIGDDLVKGEELLEEVKRAGFDEEFELVTDRTGKVSFNVFETRTFVLDEAHMSQRPARASRSMRPRVNRWARKSRSGVKASVPTWATGLMPVEDARRYTWEWGAHLCQLIEEGQLEQARRDRRMLALSALCMAVALRARRVLRRIN